MKTLSKLIVFCFFILATACNKESNTSLQFKVVYSTGDPVPSASITLYKSQSDLTNATNPYDVQYTDNNGMATFSISNVTELYYNIFRAQNCASNAFSKTKTGTLNSGQANLETVTVSPIGNVTFKNTSADSYDVSINGTHWQTMNGGASATAVVVSGTYIIHIKQVTGSGTPIEKDYNITVTACSQQTVSFP